MQVHMLKAKIHMARVTECILEYNGSLGIDKDLMDAAGIRPYEKILISNMENGERLETYAIESPAGSGTICLNGAAAHKGNLGDRIIIFTFCTMDEAEADRHTPTVIIPDENNRVRD